MRTAVISDIHGNLEAFKAVLQDIDSQGVDAVISLGDNIGYGADSEKVIQKMISKNISSVLGNHEMACINKAVYKWYRGDVKTALDHSLNNLSNSSVSYIKKMPINQVLNKAFFVHGFPPTSVRHYLHQVSNDDLTNALVLFDESVCFVGHTHKLMLISCENKIAHTEPISFSTILLDKQKEYFINVGSVGQSRDEKEHATYVIWDDQSYSLTIRSVEYDHQTAAKKILSAGLPLRYAQAVDKNIRPL